jgi:FlgD Ig-like domain
MKKYFILGLLILSLNWMVAQDIQMPPCDDMYTDCITNGPAHLETELFINCETTADQEQILLKFDFSGMQGIQIESASLNLHRYFSCGGGGGTTTAMIYLVNEEWDEETWDQHTFVQCDSTSGFAYAFSGPAGGQDTWFEVDISDFVNLWMYANQPNYGMVIIADPTQRHSKYNSKEAANADFHPYINLTLPVSADDPIENPIISLSNYPNPFNPTTTINFELNTETSENTELVIYNSNGQRVREYSISNNQSSIVWNGTDQSEQPVSSGIYFYKIISGNFEQSNKMILLK